MSFSTAFVSQLQLWHLHWLVLVQSVGDMNSISRRRFCNRAAYDITQFEFPRLSQYSSCVYSMITRTQNSPAVHCVLSTLKQELHRRDKRNYSEVCYAPWTAACIWKSKRLRKDVYKIFYLPNFLNKEPRYGELMRPFISVLYKSQNWAALARSVSRLSYGLNDTGFEIR